MAHARKLIEEIQACDKDGSSDIDFNSPFYGNSRDMRISEVEEIHKQLIKAA